MVQAPKLDSTFVRIAQNIGDLVELKNQAYGDSFARSGEIMAILYPAGIAPHQMADALAIVRILDKLFRIASDRDAFGEDPARDIAGYGILMVARRAAAKSAQPADSPSGA